MPAGKGLSPSRKRITCTAGLALGCLMGVEPLLSFSPTDPHLGLHSVLLPRSQGGIRLSRTALMY